MARLILEAERIAAVIQGLVPALGTMSTLAAAALLLLGGAIVAMLRRRRK